MRTRISWLAVLVTAGMALAPRAVRAQDTPGLDFFKGLSLMPSVVRGQSENALYEVPPPHPVNPTMFGHPRYEEGGLYVAGEAKFFKTTNTMGEQLVAKRGLLDRDGSISAALGLPDPHPNTFIGSGNPALDTEQVTGPSTFEPGFNFVIGWRFRNGVAVEFSWWHMFEAHYSASASLNPLGTFGQFQEETFLFSPVFNNPAAFDGPGNQVGIGNVGATRGIWNAANLEIINFTQRFDQYEISLRYPLYQNEDCGYRMYGLFGPRITWFWERFLWTTVAANVNGLTLADDVARYTNVVSNRLYGVHLGIGNEWELGTTPAGSFAVSVDLQAAMFVDFVATQAKYELGDFSNAGNRHRTYLEAVPEVQANVSLWWYPYEAVQVRIGYDIMAFFNTMAAVKPIDFNYGALAPPWESGIFRLLDGFSFGIAVVF
jgi:hypothetical protein